MWTEIIFPLLERRLSFNLIAAAELSGKLALTSSRLKECRPFEERLSIHSDIETAVFKSKILRKLSKMDNFCKKLL